MFYCDINDHLNDYIFSGLLLCDISEHLVKDIVCGLFYCDINDHLNNYIFSGLLLCDISDPLVKDIVCGLFYCGINDHLNNYIVCGLLCCDISDHLVNDIVCGLLFCDISDHLVKDIVCGLLYCDISDHLSCFASLQPQRAQVINDRLNIRIFGECNFRKFINIMEFENWEFENTYDANWYANVIVTVIDKCNACFLFVRVSLSKAT